MAIFRCFALTIACALFVCLAASVSAQFPPNPYWCSKYAEYGWDFDKIPAPCRCGGMDAIDIVRFNESRKVLSFDISVVCGGVSRLEDIQESWQSGYFAPSVSNLAKAVWNITDIQVNVTLFLTDTGPLADNARLQWNDLLNTPFKGDKDSDALVMALTMEKLHKLPTDSKNPKSVSLNSTKFRQLTQLTFIASKEDEVAAIPNDMFIVGKQPDIPMTISFQGHNLTSYTVAPNAFRQLSLNRQLIGMSIFGALAEVPFAMLSNTHFSSRASVFSSQYSTLSFSSNNITSVEVPAQYRGKLNFQFSEVSFDYNKLTEIGDHPLWNHMQKNAPIYTIGLAENQIKKISEKAFDAVMAVAANETERTFDFELISNALTEVPSFFKHAPPNIVAYIGWNNITSAKKSDFNEEWLKARKGERWAGYLLGNPYNCNRQKLGWFACWIQDIMQSLDEPPISMDCANKQQEGKTMTEWVKSTLARDGTCKGYFPDDNFFH